MAIAVDAQILIWGVKKQATDARKDMIPRAEYFFQRCKSDRTQVLLPAQSLAEFLVGFSADQCQEMLSRLSRAFIIAPFDAKAAAIAAELQGNWPELKQIGEEHGIAKQRIKSDINVLASSIAAGATHLYSEDGQMTSFAKGRILIAKLPLIPPRQPDLLGIDI